MHRVHGVVALKLYPNAVRTRSREHGLEFDLRSTVGEKRVLVHHVDEIGADGKHVCPHAKVSLQTMRPVDSKPYLGAVAGDWLFGDRGKGDAQICAALLRVITLELNRWRGVPFGTNTVSLASCGVAPAG